MRTAILYNPVSGRGRAAELARRLTRRLEGEGHSVACRATEPEGGATGPARRLGDVDLVVVLGGDGSVRETVSGLGDAAHTTRIAIVPLGNANVVARELGIPLDPETALDVATSTATRAYDLGSATLTRANGGADTIPFLAMVGAGYDAGVVRGLARARATRLGRIAYALWADFVYFLVGFRTAFARQAACLRCAIDGQPRAPRYRAAIVSNARTYGKSWAMCPDARCDDARLDLHARKRSALPWLALHLLLAIFSRRAPATLSDLACGRGVRIESSQPIAVQIDGDDCGDAVAIEAQLRRDTLRFAVPASG